MSSDSVNDPDHPGPVQPLRPFVTVTSVLRFPSTLVSRKEKSLGVGKENFKN